MAADFVKVLQGALVVKSDEIASSPISLGSQNGSKVLATQGKKKDKKDVYLNLSEILLKQKTSKLMPDIDFTKVRISHKKQFENFIQMHSCFHETNDRRIAGSKSFVSGELSQKLKHTEEDTSDDESTGKKDVSDDELGLNGPNWKKDILPIVQKQYEQAFQVYQEWQINQIKEFSNVFDKKVEGVRTETKKMVDSI